MRALLLAAGLGTRLRPLTDSVPKCLVPVRGRPLLGYWIELLADAGIERIVVNLHHRAEQVLGYVTSHPRRHLVVTAREDSLVGTGGSILLHLPLLGRGPFLVIHADNLSRFDVGAFLERHRRRPSGCELTMLTFETDRPETCGIVTLDAAGVVTAFEEKPRAPRGRVANGAVYVVEPSVIDFLEGLGKTTVDFSTEVLPAFMGRIATFPCDGYHRDIGSPESYARAQLDTGYLVRP